MLSIALQAELCYSSLQIEGICMNVIVYNVGCVRESTMATHLEKDLKSKGHHLTYKLKDADAIVYVSCASTGYALKKCFEEINSFMFSKKKETKFILAGCLAEEILFQKYLEREDFKLITNRDFVIPIENYLFEEQKRNTALLKLKHRTRLLCENNTSIQFILEEGCINHCTFCKYNYLDRYVKSVPYNKALEHLKSLIQKGTKSITLSGENTSLFGIDLNGKPMLHQFVHDLSLADGLERINLYEVCPQNMYPELLTEIIKNPKVYCVEMQLEMAPNRLLGLMNRNHTIEEHLYYVKSIQESGKFVKTILMCSFPTETYEDLDYTIDIIQKNKILVGHICRYSDFACIPSHKLEQLSYHESRRHASYLRNQIALINKEIMLDAIPNMQNSIVIGKTNNKVFLDNFVNGYSFRKEYQDCNVGDSISDKPRTLVRNKNLKYTYNYKW